MCFPHSSCHAYNGMLSTTIYGSMLIAPVIELLGCLRLDRLPAMAASGRILMLFLVLLISFLHGLYQLWSPEMSGSVPAGMRFTRSGDHNILNSLVAMVTWRRIVSIDHGSNSTDLWYIAGIYILHVLPHPPPKSLDLPAWCHIGQSQHVSAISVRPTSATDYSQRGAFFCLQVFTHMQVRRGIKCVCWMLHTHYSIVLHCIVLYCIVLAIVLHCIVLHCVVCMHVSIYALYFSCIDIDASFKACMCILCACAIIGVLVFVHALT